MWVVRAGDHLYVRSAYGPDNPWYRRALTAAAGRIRSGGVEKDVTFVLTDPSESGVQRDIDAAYHRKYDHYGPKIVGSVVGNAAHRVPLRLAPRSGKE